MTRLKQQRDPGVLCFLQTAQPKVPQSNIHKHIFTEGKCRETTVCGMFSNFHEEECQKQLGTMDWRQCVRTDGQISLINETSSKLQISSLSIKHVGLIVASLCATQMRNNIKSKTKKRLACVLKATSWIWGGKWSSDTEKSQKNKNKNKNSFPPLLSHREKVKYPSLFSDSRPTPNDYRRLFVLGVFSPQGDNLSFRFSGSPMQTR